jgi:hypothetical protein
MSRQAVATCPAITGMLVSPKSILILIFIQCHCWVTSLLCCRSAWWQVRGMSADEAMQQYIRLVSSIAPDWQAAAANAAGGGSSSSKPRQGGAMGPVFSRPAAVALEERLPGVDKAQQVGHPRGVEAEGEGKGGCSAAVYTYLVELHHPSALTSLPTCLLYGTAGQAAAAA